MINGKLVAQLFAENGKKAPNSNLTKAEQAFPLKGAKTRFVKAKGNDH